MNIVNFSTCKGAILAYGFMVAGQHFGCQDPNSGQERPLLLLPPKSVEVCRVPLESGDRGLEFKLELCDQTG